MPENAITSTLAELAELGIFTGMGDIYVAMMTTEDTAASPPAYDTPLIACEGVSAGLTPGYAEGKLSASNRTRRKAKILVSMDVKTEYPGMKSSVHAMILGRKKDVNGGVGGGDTMTPLLAVGVCATRDNGTKLMRWVYKCRASEDTVEMKTGEEGQIAYQIPVLNYAGVSLSYETVNAKGEQEHLVQYIADTQDPDCKWTPETFFAAVVGPWSAAIQQTNGG